MKIQLERTLPTCPHHVACTVCCQPFPVQSIRTLLFTDRGWLQGDVCPDCMKLGSEGIRQTLRQRAVLLKKQAQFTAELSPAPTLAIHELATELETCAREAVKFPTLWQWWLKRWQIATQEAQELESARLGLSRCRCGHSTPLRIRFQADEPGVND